MFVLLGSVTDGVLLCLFFHFLHIFAKPEVGGSARDMGASGRDWGGSRRDPKIPFITLVMIS